MFDNIKLYTTLCDCNAQRSRAKYYSVTLHPLNTSLIPPGSTRDATSQDSVANEAMSLNKLRIRDSVVVRQFVRFRLPPTAQTMKAAGTCARNVTEASL